MRTNKYASACHSCPETVEAHTGHLTLVNGKWRVTHTTCSAYAASEVISATGRALPAHGFNERLLRRRDTESWHAS